MNTSLLERYRAILALTCLLVLPCSPGHAADKPAPGLDAKVQQQQEKIERLQKGIAGQKDMVKVARDRESSLLVELERLDQKISETKAALASLKEQLDIHEKAILEKQTAMAVAKEAKEAAQSHIKNRLNAYYRMGPIGVMNVIFSTSELPDLLNFREYYDTLLAYDQLVIKDYRVQIEALNTAHLALQEEKKALLDSMAKVKEQETVLDTSRQDRLALLAKVKTEKKLYQLALDELQEAADKLSGTLAELKAEAAKQKQKKKRRITVKKKRPTNFGFENHKGKLNPPVPGTVTTLFGKNTQGKFGITTFANGIDIKTAPGTQISAIYDGKVVYAGFLRGYGNLLIIDHGQQYYSLVSRAENFFKQEGDTVVKGEVIGIMSDQDGLLGEGLHFEIRHGTDPENPLQWVNNAKLTIKATTKASN